VDFRSAIPCSGFYGCCIISRMGRYAIENAQEQRLPNSGGDLLLNLKDISCGYLAIVTVRPQNVPALRFIGLYADSKPIPISSNAAFDYHLNLQEAPNLPNIDAFLSEATGGPSRHQLQLRHAPEGNGQLISQAIGEGPPFLVAVAIQKWQYRYGDGSNFSGEALRNT